MIRTRFAPSPTGYMHIGNLRTALYEYLIAKKAGGRFILRIEDTDQNRQVEGAVEMIYSTLQAAGLQHDEGPDIGGAYGPYIQSERKEIYLRLARELIQKGKAYYCFCGKERLEALTDDRGIGKYDRRCLPLTKERIQENLAQNMPYVIRQIIPEGETSFHDEVFGEITVPNGELDDQILIKSDGLPTYNFANVADDHLMGITHVIRGSEYLSSTPKYNLLYEAFGWPVPAYIHLPLILNANGEKLSKRKGDASFEDLTAMGFLPEAIVNYIALLGWSPAENREIFTLAELVDCFDTAGLSKSPSIFDIQKLTWMNGEYFKRMDPEAFYAMSLKALREAVRTPGVDLRAAAEMARTRVNFLHEIKTLFGFMDSLPAYDERLYEHKKMKTSLGNSLDNLQKALPVLESLEIWQGENIHAALMALIGELGVKNGQMLWPIRTALSGQPSSPCGAIELCALLGKGETLRRIRLGVDLLEKAR
ncbi:MAG: glutamate--tRNA ligase [Clostridiales bacterium]|nr:glutamate--tRNA ligase [Clostridiales bacterium]